MTGRTPASKKEKRERAAQRQAELRRLERRRRLRNYSIGGLVVVVLAALFAAAIAADRRGEDIEGLQVFSGLSANHIEEPVEGDSAPPVGGDHSAAPLTCGIYTSAVPIENAVHSLEHGAVWIAYRPDLDEAEVEDLRAFVRSQRTADQAYMILSPYPDLSGPVVASAWGRQLVLDDANDPRLGDFTSTFIRGQQSPEPGAACQGVGTPTN